MKVTSEVKKSEILNSILMEELRESKNEIAKTCKTSHSLIRHKKIHMSEVEKEEKYYKCEICFKLFARSDNFESHAKSHKKCDIRHHHS